MIVPYYPLHTQIASDTDASTEHGLTTVDTVSTHTRTRGTSLGATEGCVSPSTTCPRAHTGRKTGLASSCETMPLRWHAISRTTLCAVVVGTSAHAADPAA